MIVSQIEVRSRIESLKMSESGYKRQLERLDLSPERREMLQDRIAISQSEVATLEKVAQLIRSEPDSEKVEAAVRDRLAVVRRRVDDAGHSADLPPEDRVRSAGEIRGLLWVLGEDELTLSMQRIMEDTNRKDPTRTDRALPSILLHRLTEAPDPEERANAAYEIGKLGISEAIPALLDALSDQGLVADVALRALAMFQEEELKNSGASDEVLRRIHPA
jgi:hypothetical protein